MQKEYDSYVRLLITDFEVDPSEITQILKMQPTETWKSGDTKTLRKAKVPIKYNIWRLDSELPLHSSIEKHINHILSKIDVENLKNLPPKSEVHLECAIYFKNDRPGIHLTKEVMLQMSKYSVELDLDMYCV